MSHRRESMASHVRQVVSHAINFEMGDPRLEGLAITQVKLSPDLQFADIQYAVPEGDDPQPAQQALEKARVALRKIVAQKISFRRVPELRFHVDRGAIATKRIEAILEDLKKEKDSDRADDET